MPICEKCGKEHDGSYGSGRFCSKECARGFSGLAKTEEAKSKLSETIKNLPNRKTNCIKCR